MNNTARIVAMSMALAAALALQACATSHAGKGAEKEEGDEVKIKFTDVPAAVQATLTREANGAAIADVDKETDDGKMIYEADAMISGKNYEIKVSADGSLVSKKLDAEEGAEKAGEKDEKKE